MVKCGMNILRTWKTFDSWKLSNGALVKHFRFGQKQWTQPCAFQLQILKHLRTAPNIHVWLCQIPIPKGCFVWPVGHQSVHLVWCFCAGTKSAAWLGSQDDWQSLSVKYSTGYFPKTLCQCILSKLALLTFPMEFVLSSGDTNAKHTSACGAGKTEYTRSNIFTPKSSYGRNRSSMSNKIQQWSF